MAAGGAGGSSKTYSFKVVLLGEGCVGKTSLVLRYCENKFNDKHITTLQVRMSARATDAQGWLTCVVYVPFEITVSVVNLYADTVVSHPYSPISTLGCVVPCRQKAAGCPVISYQMWDVK